VDSAEVEGSVVVVAKKVEVGGEVVWCVEVEVPGAVRQARARNVDLVLVSIHLHHDRTRGLGLTKSCLLACEKAVQESIALYCPNSLLHFPSFPFLGLYFASLGHQYSSGPDALCFLAMIACRSASSRALLTFVGRNVSKSFTLGYVDLLLVKLLRGAVSVSGW
jgi:hypothetical protein